MRILITGSSGFIGRHLTDALLRDGHQLVCAVRRVPAGNAPEGVRYVEADFTRDLLPETWTNRLENVDAVINAVGIIRENDAQTFDALHTYAPRALFAACARKKIRLIVQISALGADDDAKSRYHLSKKAADDFLLANNLPATILQPSLVYGPGGASAALFNTLATMPFLVKFGHGRQMVQPVHVDDVVDAVRAALQRIDQPPTRIAVVGPVAMTLTDFIVSLRTAMHLRRPMIVPVPLGMARLAARLAGLFKSSPLDGETFGMLERGNTADSAAVCTLAGKAPRGVARFIAPADALNVRLQSQMNWLLPLLRGSIAMVWMVTGVLSLGIYPIEDSKVLLERTGIPDTLQPLMLYGAALLDIAIGIAILFIRRKWIWVVQLALILFYSAVIAWRLPEFLLHPYGPVLKNLPMLAAIWLLMAQEKR
ncbi:MAG TPA: SDR family oxidoreductase [Oxalicibacterium sp.]|uniref:SDR family oxidoreductase n=1 Tax=Oxalicibacterium sp. TaxID=2766525 RepID=UPI002C61DB5F|nr:SDR family oxidoreductase [Oxalicibacterium sp.]HWU98165.1 SDR family oxidoreductase [Oxalicibacterium sp.]